MEETSLPNKTELNRVISLYFLPATKDLLASAQLVLIALRTLKAKQEAV